MIQYEVILAVYVGNFVDNLILEMFFLNPPWVRTWISK